MIKLKKSSETLIDAISEEELGRRMPLFEEVSKALAKATKTDWRLCPMTGDSLTGYDRIDEQLATHKETW